MDYNTDSVNNRAGLYHTRTQQSSNKDPHLKFGSYLDNNTKSLLSNAIAKYLKKLHVHSRVQGNPSKAEARNQIEAILDNLHPAAKKNLAEYSGEISAASGKFRDKQAAIDKFMQLALTKTFKNITVYSQRNPELLNNKVKDFINKTLNNFEDITKASNQVLKETLGANSKQTPVSALQPRSFESRVNAFQQRGPEEYTARSSEVANEPIAKSVATDNAKKTDKQKSADQEVADKKLKEINDAKEKFQTGYNDLINKLRSSGFFLSLTKSYSALHNSAAETQYYADTAIIIENSTEEQQQELAQTLFNTLTGSSSHHKQIVEFLKKQGVKEDEANKMKKYFEDKAGNFPKDAKSLLNIILTPKHGNLYTAGGKAEKDILNFRMLVFKGLTVIKRGEVNTLFNPTDEKKPGTLKTEIKYINNLIDKYNDFVKQHPDITSTKFFIKMTFNEATGGFVMFSTFADEYRIAESERQSASLTSEGYNKTLGVLEEIQAVLDGNKSAHTDSDASDEDYLSGLTDDQLAYLKSLVLVKGGKSIGEKYLKDVTLGTKVSRTIITSVTSELSAIVKNIEDSNQKISVILQDATEKRNAASTTLSKFLDKIYDIYKLVMQF